MADLNCDFMEITDLVQDPSRIKKLDCADSNHSLFIVLPDDGVEATRANQIVDERLSRREHTDDVASPTSIRSRDSDEETRPLPSPNILDDPTPLARDTNGVAAEYPLQRVPVGGNPTLPRYPTPVAASNNPAAIRRNRRLNGSNSNDVGTPKETLVSGKGCDAIENEVNPRERVDTKNEEVVGERGMDLDKNDRGVILQNKDIDRLVRYEKQDIIITKQESDVNKNEGSVAKTINGEVSYDISEQISFVDGLDDNKQTSTECSSINESTSQDVCTPRTNCTSATERNLATECSLATDCSLATEHSLATERSLATEGSLATDCTSLSTNSSFHSSRAVTTTASVECGNTSSDAIDSLSTGYCIGDTDDDLDLLDELSAALNQPNFGATDFQEKYLETKALLDISTAEFLRLVVSRK